MRSKEVPKNKLPTFWVVLLKVVLPLWVLIAVLTPFMSGGKLHEMLQAQWVDFSIIPIWVLPIILLLSFVNYGLEAQKWKLSLAKLEPINLKKALQSVYKGCAMSQVFPWRTGDFLGKISVLPLQKKAQGVFLSAMNSFAQLLITLLIGMAGLACIQSKNYTLKTHEYDEFVFIMALIGCSFLVLFLFFLGKRSWQKVFVWVGPKYRKYIYESRWLSNRAVWQLVGLSALRYLSFVIPYLILLLPFTEVQEWLSLSAGLSLVFLLQSLLPGFILTDLPVRGFLHSSILVPIIGLYTPVGNAVFIIFVANQIIPALLGFYFMLKTPVQTQI